MRKFALVSSCSLLSLSVALSAALVAAPGASVPLGPPLWASKPDIKAFDAIEDGRLAAARKSIDAIVAEKGKRTIENTLVPYDEATRNLDSTASFRTTKPRGISIRPRISRTS
jgi:hypothetical protein